MIFARFRPRLGVVTASITSSPASFLFVLDPDFFFLTYMLSVDTCSRYMIYTYNSI